MGILCSTLFPPYRTCSEMYASASAIGISGVALPTPTVKTIDMSVPHPLTEYGLFALGFKHALTHIHTHNRY